MNETFTDAVTLKTQTGKDAFGKPVYDAGRPAKCRFMVRQKLTRDLGGNQVISEGVVMCDSPVNMGDLLMMGGRSYTALSAYQVKDLAGNGLYWEVIV